MKATIETHEFNRVLKQAVSISGRSIFEDIRIQFMSKKAGGSYITAHNGVVAMKQPFGNLGYTVGKDKAKDFCVNGKKFAALIAQIDAEEIELVTTEKYVSILAGSGKYRIATNDSATVLDIEFTEPERWHKLPTDRFITALERGVATVQKDSYVAMGGVYLKTNDGVLDIVGTNGHRMSVSTVTGVDIELNHVLDDVAARKILAFAKSASDTYIGVMEAMIHFSADDIWLVCNTLVAEFPDYKRVIAPGKELDTKITVNAAKLKQAINLAKITAPMKSPCIKIACAEHQMRLYGVDPLYGESEVAIPFTGSDVTYGFLMDPKYLYDGASLFTEKGELQILLPKHDADKETQVNGIFMVGEGFTYTVMPRTG